MRKKIVHLRLEQWANEFNPCGQWYRIRIVTLNSAKSLVSLTSRLGCRKFTQTLWTFSLYSNLKQNLMFWLPHWLSSIIDCVTTHFIVDIYLIAIVDCIEHIKNKLNLAFRKCVNNKQEAKCFSFVLCVGVFSFQCTSVSIRVSNSVCIELRGVYFKCNLSPFLLRHSNLKNSSHPSIPFYIEREKSGKREKKCEKWNLSAPQGD